MTENLWVRTKTFAVSKTPVEQQTFIADPTGGTTTDAEARTAINAILDVLIAYGLIASS